MWPSAPRASLKLFWRSRCNRYLVVFTCSYWMVIGAIKSVYCFTVYFTVIHFLLCVLVHRCLHGTAPAYPAESFHSTTEVSARRCLWSANNLSLIIPSTRRSTLGDRAFPVAASRAWNSLPNSMRNIESLQSFRRELRTSLFLSSFDNRRYSC